MPNILQQAEMLKDVSDQRIRQEMQRPTGQFPLYLVSSEAKRRADLRQRFKAERSGPPSQTTVQQDLMAALAGQTPPMAQPISPNRAVAPGQGPGSPLNPQGTPPTGVPLPPPQRGFAHGGVVHASGLKLPQGFGKYFPGQQAPQDYDQDAYYEELRQRARDNPRQYAPQNVPSVIQSILGKTGGVRPTHPSVAALDDRPDWERSPIHGEDVAFLKPVPDPIYDQVWGPSKSTPYHATSGAMDDAGRYIPPPPVVPTPEELAAKKLETMQQGILTDYKNLKMPTPYDERPVAERDVVTAEERAAATFDPTALTSKMSKYGGKALDLTPMSDPNQLYKERLATLSGQPDPYSGIAARLDKRDADIAGAAETDKWLALARGGFSAAGGTSQYALENIGKGATEGLEDYATSRKANIARKERATDARTALIGIQEQRKAGLRDQANQFANRKMSAEKYANNIKQIEHTAAIQTYEVNQNVARFNAEQQYKAEVQRSTGATRALDVKQAAETRRAAADAIHHRFAQRNDQFSQTATQALELAKIKGKETQASMYDKKIEAKKTRELRKSLQKIVSNAEPKSVKAAKAYIDGTPELRAAMEKFSPVGAATAKAKSANISRSWLAATKAFYGDTGGVEAPTKPDDKAIVRELFVNNLIAYMGRGEAELYADALMGRMGGLGAGATKSLGKPLKITNTPPGG